MAHVAQAAGQTAVATDSAVPVAAEVISQREVGVTKIHGGGAAEWRSRRHAAMMSR